MARPVPHQVYVRRRIAAACLALLVVVGGFVLVGQLTGDDDVLGTNATVTDPAAGVIDGTGTIATPGVAGGTDVTAVTAVTVDPTTAASTVVGVASAPDGATTVPPTVAPTGVAPPSVDAATYAVYDLTTGTWLAESGADTPRPVGSLMKLLTAHVVMEAGDLTRTVTVPALTMDPNESAIGLYAGEQLPRDVLVRAMLIVSANDAAKALAIDNAGSEAAFVERMNAAARQLGLANTTAANASGLDGNGAQSTARDMITLGSLLMEDADFRTTVARTEARLHGQVFTATNDLLTAYVGADGIKTGTTTQAGYCLLGSATRDGRTVLVAVLGSSSEAARVEATVSLLDWAFGNT